MRADMTFALADVARDGDASPWLMAAAGVLAVVALVLAVVFLIRRSGR